MPKKNQVSVFWPLVALKQFATFSGRARRKEFWYFVLVYFWLELAVIIVFAPLLPLVQLTLLLPLLAVTVRRLHDRGHSGWWVLISFVPFGILGLTVVLALKGDEGTNDYGTDPIND